MKTSLLLLIGLTLSLSFDAGASCTLKGEGVFFTVSNNKDFYQMAGTYEEANQLLQTAAACKDGAGQANSASATPVCYLIAKYAKYYVKALALPAFKVETQFNSAEEAVTARDQMVKDNHCQKPTQLPVCVRKKDKDNIFDVYQNKYVAGHASADENVSKEFEKHLVSLGFCTASDI